MRHSCQVTHREKLRISKSEVVTELSDEGKLRLKVIENLMEPCSKTVYGQKLREAAIALKISVRSVQRLVKKWEKEGLSAIAATKRADKGQHRVDEDWQKFILKTYQDGNKGGRRMTRKQVVIRAQARAEELGIKPLSHMSVYRILKPVIEKQEQAKSIRSPGAPGKNFT